MLIHKYFRRSPVWIFGKRAFDFSIFLRSISIRNFIWKFEKLLHKTTLEILQQQELERHNRRNNSHIFHNNIDPRKHFFRVQRPKILGRLCRRKQRRLLQFSETPRRRRNFLSTHQFLQVHDRKCLPVVSGYGK